MIHSRKNKEPISVILFRANPKSPEYIGVYESVLDAEKDATGIGDDCFAIVTPICPEAAEAAFEFVLMTMSKVDSAWTHLISEEHL